MPTIPVSYSETWYGPDFDWRAFNGGHLKYRAGLNTREIDPYNGYSFKLGVLGKGKDKRFFVGLYLFAMWDENALLNDSGSALLEKWFTGPYMSQGPKKWKLVDSSIFSGPMGYFGTPYSAGRP